MIDMGTIPEDLRSNARQAADQLDRAKGVWSQNIAKRLRAIADYGSTPAEFIGRNVSLADYNHIQARVNMLLVQLDVWSNDSGGQHVLEEISRELAEARRQQSTIIELIQFPRIFG